MLQICSSDYYVRLVDDLGLKSTLTEYNVPREDIPLIAAHGVHGADPESPIFKRTVQALESLY